MLWHRLSLLLFYSHYDTVKSRAGHKQYREWRLCIASLKKQAVLPICKPLFSVNYRGEGAWSALNLSCWQESCTSWLVAFFYIDLHMRNDKLELYPSKPSKPKSLFPFFCTLFRFIPERVCGCRWNVKGNVKLETLFNFLVKRKWCELMVVGNSRLVCEPLSTFFFLISTVHFLRVFHICAYVD